ncbi:arginase family protein [Enterococcus cecorum]|uniref:arginase family protein n=1 Tax=Enterococcus cecorum TaxID=44008 RepID=UPI0032C40A8C
MNPEAGGIFFMEFVESLKLISQLNIVALDVNELSPTLDQSGASTALACKVVRELLLAIH